MKRIRFALLFLLTLSMLAGCTGKPAEPAPAETPAPQPAAVEPAQTPPESNEESGEAFAAVTTEELQDKLKDNGWVIVDTRLTDSYNGWKLDGEERGGHIEGAVDFSFNWLNTEAENKEEWLNNALTEKGILPDKNIVLYDANGQDALKVAEYLKSKNYPNIYIYDVKEWAKEASLPMEQYENYQMIVPAKVVKQILDGEKPETFENAGIIKMVDGGWGGPEEAYNAGHIPTSFHIDTDTLEPPPAWMLDTDENLAKRALEYGFNKDDTVIVSGADQMAAYRVAVILRYIGVSDVRVINGGNGAWVAAGYELETESHQPVPAADFGAEIPVNKDLIVTIPELKERLEQPEAYCLVDNRGWDEYIGASTGYSYHDKSGRIPGAVYGYAGEEGTGNLSYFRNIDNTMRNKDEMLALWEGQDIDLDKHLMFMCGSGWRAAEILYYAQAAGLPNTSLYSDGWIGWSNNPENPTVTGE